ncbi:unnamed protein product [Didymodactylos carnosus]|uniref:Uncharacterized protein n=2 Tax=Didymodactylos carnosus TaxID=1234261 RepID=A0A815TVD3_9BILA|nr:unnamed protein product [Didymodactylos carnosus]CAF4372408.1 unnamed protein product [Didymodactylos carnosus]
MEYLQEWVKKHGWESEVVVGGGDVPHKLGELVVFCIKHAQLKVFDLDGKATAFIDYKTGVPPVSKYNDAYVKKMYGNEYEFRQANEMNELRNTFGENLNNWKVGKLKMLTVATDSKGVHRLYTTQQIAEKPVKNFYPTNVSLPAPNPPKDNLPAIEEVAPAKSPLPLAPGNDHVEFAANLFE